MAYVAQWLHGDEIVAEEDFANLLDAQAHVLRHLQDYFRQKGADTVKVRQGSRICFGIAIGGTGEVTVSAKPHAVH